MNCHFIEILSNLFRNFTTELILLLSIACRIITNSQTFWQKLMLHIVKKKITKYYTIKKKTAPQGAHDDIILPDW